MRVPRPYQVQAIDFLKAHPQAGLFMDMGLGKTGATLLALLSKPRPILIVGPIRVIETVWEPEAQLWSGTQDLTFSLIRGSPQARKAALATDADIYLVNPELLEEALLARSWGTLVVDESSMFKNPSTKRFKLLRKHVRKIPHRIILTGTPTPNSLMDLWSQIFILDLGERLDTAFYRFKARYFFQADYMGYKFEAHEGAEERVTKLISDIVLRIEAKGNLPDREVINNPVKFNLPPKARKAYDQMAKDAFFELMQSEVTAATAAAAMMKLRQVASGFAYDDTKTPIPIHDEKIQIVGEILEQTGSPVIVVYNFVHELAALRNAFPHGVTLDDGWNQKDWDAGRIPLLFLHPQSGGHGLNLQYGCHTMIICSASFSSEQMDQTRARIDRQGQEFPVVFHWVTAIDTVDELLIEVLEAKAKTQSSVLAMIKEYASAHR
jgi:SNF2 family DNA or RNA helicase